MKERYYVILLGIVVLGFIVGIWRLRSGTSSSPEATVKAFYEALNEGNLSKAREYTSPQWESLPYNIEGLKLIVGEIQKAEIEGTSTEKVLGTELTMVVVKVTLKPGVEEKFESLYREADKKVKAYEDGTLKESVKGPEGDYMKALRERQRLYWLMGFPGNFQGKHTWGLQKWDGKWKISSRG